MPEGSTPLTSAFSATHEQAEKVQSLQGTQVSRSALMALPLLRAGFRYARSAVLRVLGRCQWRAIWRRRPLPGGFSRARVSDGKGENDDEEF